MKIFLAIPCSNSEMKIHTTSSLLRTQSGLAKQGIQISFDFFNFAEVSVARNVLAARFINSDCTDLLFCDDDISFEPQVIGDLISAKAPFVGAGCVLRDLDLDKYAAVRKKLKPGKKDDENRQNALRSATKVNYVPVSPVNRNGNLIEAIHVGFGLTLIRREVLLAMQSAGVAKKQASGQRWADADVYGYFDRIYSEEKRGTLSEDFSFCYRWRQCGGQIWVLENARTRHHGEFAYQNW